MEQRSAAAVVLTAVRLERGLSQQTAAETNQLQGSVWSKLETGRLKPYSLELTMRLKDWTKGDVTPEMWREEPSKAQLARLLAAKKPTRRAA